MSHQVTDVNGQVHEFPDDATPEMMEAAINESAPKQKYKNFREDMQGMGHELQNEAGGFMGTMQKAASGLGEAGQWLGDTVAKKIYKDMTGKELNIPKVNIREQMGLEGQNQFDLNKAISSDPNSVSSKIGSLMPYLVGGASSVGKTALGGGAMSGLTADPDEKLLSSHLPGVGQYMPEGQLASGIENTLIGMLLPSVVKGGAKAVMGTKNAITEAMQAKSMAKGIQKNLTSESERLNDAVENQTKYVQQQTDKAVEGIDRNVADTSKQVSQDLGKGHQTLPQVSESIANDVRQLHDAREANASIYFQHVLDQVNATPDKGLLYKKADPLISTALDEGKGLMSQVGDLNVGELGEIFNAKPTFENAHNLKQELGLMIGNLKKFPPRSAAERLEFSKLSNAYHKLDQDMKNYLETKFPDKNTNLSSQWEKGQEIYKETVAPYLSNEKLREITRGRKRYVNDIHEAFADPTAGDEISREIDKVTGKPKVIQGAGSKVLNDMSQETKDKILFSKIGANNGTAPNKLIEAVDKAKVNGFEHYESPNLRANLNHMLEQQQKAKELVKASEEHIDQMKHNVKKHLVQQEREARPVVEALQDKSKIAKKLLNRTLGYSIAGILGHRL